MKLRWTPGAVDELVEIARYIGTDSPIAARKWAEKIRKQTRKLIRFPKAGRVVPEFGRENLRELIVGNYRIVYAMRREEVQVLSVFEGHRVMVLETTDIE